ncbi:MAG: hypothetical protein ACOYCB_13015 [Fastidiosipilaceae bacterium]|jgi:hypothetical protein
MPVQTMKTLSKSRHRYILKKRTNKEWEKALKAIRSDEIRTMCCLIVWFDFFSECEPRRESPQVIIQAKADWNYWSLVHRQLKTTPKHLENALIRLGYHPDIAHNRSLVLAE